MTVARREERRVLGEPSASLLRLNRHATSNVLILGGSAAERVAVAGALHHAGRLRDAPFRALSCASEFAALHRALLAWLGHGQVPAALECEQGTLFLDDISELPPVAQKLLLACARRRDPSSTDPTRGPSRFAAGTSVDLRHDVASGYFDGALYDSLDKMCIHLGRLSLRHG